MTWRFTIVASRDRDKADEIRDEPQEASNTTQKIIDEQYTILMKKKEYHKLPIPEIKKKEHDFRVCRH